MSKLSHLFRHFDFCGGGDLTDADCCWCPSFSVTAGLAVGVVGVVLLCLQKQAKRRRRSGGVVR